MCAVTENGQVVGLITKVGVNWATITTIMDSSLEISASIASSGYTGVVQGTYLPDGSSILRMNYLLTDAIIKTTTRSSQPARRSIPEGFCSAISQTRARTRRALRNTQPSIRRAIWITSNRSLSSPNTQTTEKQPAKGRQTACANDTKCPHVGFICGARAVCAGVQTVSFGRPRLWRQALLLPVLVACVSMHVGSEAGGVFGMACGLCGRCLAQTAARFTLCCLPAAARSAGICATGIWCAISFLRF